MLQGGSDGQGRASSYRKQKRWTSRSCLATRSIDVSRKMVTAMPSASPARRLFSTSSSSQKAVMTASPGTAGRM